MTKVEMYKIKLATALSNKVNSMHRRAVKIISLLLIVLFSVVSYLSIYNALQGNTALVSVQKIRLPTYWKGISQPSSDISLDREYGQALRFLRYMDSLQIVDPKKRDSILKLRPQLLDSARLLIRFYEQPGIINQ